MRALYSLTLFLSSGLLFLVQPMVAKMILPRFGGSPAVWTAAMLFFQILLLAGYAYAHFSVKWLGNRVQPIIHLVFLGIAAISLPIALPSLPADAASENGVFPVLWTLLRMVGLPFFVLSAGAPLIQRWFATTQDVAAKDPYFLYSASNLGSMISLLAYPFLVEPRLRLSDQTKLWSYGFWVLLIAMILCASVAIKAHSSPTEAEPASAPITNQTRIRWILLAAIPSSLLLGVTNYLTSNIAPMPLLWILPLSIYLLTFIVAFARRQYVRATTWARILPLVVTPLAVVMILEATEPIALLATMHLIAFTIAALMCHTLLVDSRPNSGRLTEFYLWLSVGGALGGTFNAIVAPTIFSTLAEYPIAIVLACLMRPPKLELKPNLKVDLLFGIGMLAVVAGIAFAAKAAGMPPSQARTALIIGLPAILCFLMVDRPVRFALMLGGTFFASNLMQTSAAGQIVYSGRSFFGVHRVVSLTGDRFHELVHGNTTHGMQDTLNPDEPLTYYTRSGPVGEIFKAYSGPYRKDRIALVGLGVGSCATYGEPGQKVTYYEIDPIVVSVARNPAYFTFLLRAKSDLNIVLGDARLTLAKEFDGSFGFIALDAFSSDAIPVHLLTKEAVEMYKSKLDATGFLAFHISNRYLDLAPIVAKVAQSLGMKAYLDDDAPSTDEFNQGKRPSRWVIVARKPEDVSRLAMAHWSEIEVPDSTPLWTDDYSNILSAFKQD